MGDWSSDVWSKAPSRVTGDPLVVEDLAVSVPGVGTIVVERNRWKG